MNGGALKSSFKPQIFGTPNESKIPLPDKVKPLKNNHKDFNDNFVLKMGASIS